MLEVHVDSEHVRGAVRMPEDPGFRCEVLEVAHRFVRRDGTVWRENRLVRRTHARGAFQDEPLSENHARVASRSGMTSPERDEGSRGGLMRVRILSSTLGGRPRLILRNVDWFGQHLVSSAGPSATVKWDTPS